MKKVLKQLYAGDFNNMEQNWQADGSVVITLKRDNEPERSCKFRVKDLYGENEEVLEEEVIEVKVPKHILDRMKEAKEKNG